ncbi:hypothetical protein TNCV_3633381 [Trichonephila clavipes]|nr:hypothetical protein TNCV_3633381 [Trichonephila clavipes]
MTKNRADSNVLKRCSPRGEKWMESGLPTGHEESSGFNNRVDCSTRTPPPTMEPNKGRQPAGHLTCVRHGTYLRGGTGYSSTEPVLETAELITSRLTGAGSLLPPVYGEAWAKGHATGTPDSTFPRCGCRRCWSRTRVYVNGCGYVGFAGRRRIAFQQLACSALSWPTSAHLEQVGWPRQTVLNVQISGTESIAADSNVRMYGRTGHRMIAILTVCGSTPPPTMEPNKGRQPAGHLTCVRHGTYLRGGTGYSITEPVLESAELITSRLTGAGSLLPPVYGEAWAKGHATGTPDSTFPGTGRRTRQTCGSD